MSDEPHIDSWRHGVSQDLGEIKANIKFLVEAHSNVREEHDERIKKLETKQNRRDGIMGVIVLALPFLPFIMDPIKKLFH